MAASVSALRRRLGLSQEVFARLIGVSVGAVHKWEKGQSDPTGLGDVLLTLLTNAMAVNDPDVLRSQLDSCAGDPASVVRTLVDLERTTQAPGAKPTNASAPDTTGPVIGIHVVCRNNKGVTELEGGRFETRAWRVSEDSARSATYIALHQRKIEHSYRQGRIVEARRATDSPDRFIFTVEPSDLRLPWPGDPCPGPVLALRRSE